MAKWIEFKELPMCPDRKTKVFEVVAKEGSIKLGEIKWFGRWRKYTFNPVNNTVFEQDCLKDITDFLLELKNERSKLKESKIIHLDDYETPEKI